MEDGWKVGKTLLAKIKHLYINVYTVYVHKDLDPVRQQNVL